MVKKESFGKTANGREAFLYTITNADGMEVSLSDFGAALVSVKLPNSDGTKTDVVLGYDDAAGYENDTCCIGATVGRVCNRIGNASFTLNGKTYKLDANDGSNTLHSGFTSFSRKFYKAEILDNEMGMAFSISSPSLEQGFPGDLDATITFTLTENNELVIHYEAQSSEDTLCNFTNHSYFNLSGHDAGSILNHELVLEAKKYTPTDAGLIPTGEVRDVAGTPFDFTGAKALGRDIDADDQGLKDALGYDVNFILEHKTSEPEMCAKLFDAASKRTLCVYTTAPCVQFYTANHMDLVEGKCGAKYRFRGGVCLETQFAPDAINHPEFAQPILRKGDKYDSTTIFAFL